MPTTFQYSLKDVRPSMMFFLTIRLGEKKLDFYPWWSWFWRGSLY